MLPNTAPGTSTESQPREWLWGIEAAILLVPSFRFELEGLWEVIGVIVAGNWGSKEKGTFFNFNVRQVVVFHRFPEEYPICRLVQSHGFKHNAFEIFQFLNFFGDDIRVSFDELVDLLLEFLSDWGKHDEIINEHHRWMRSGIRASDEQSAKIWHNLVEEFRSLLLFGRHTVHLLNIVLLLGCFILDLFDPILHEITSELFVQGNPLRNVSVMSSQIVGWKLISNHEGQRVQCLTSNKF